MEQPLKKKKCQEEQLSEQAIMVSDEQPPSSPSLTNTIHDNTLIPTSELYHTSVCGSILHPVPSNDPQTIFSHLLHGNVEAFRRSVDVFYRDICTMKNEHEQTVLHVLTILVYPFKWIRLVMMRGCDSTRQDRDGNTAAHYATARDDVEMLKALTVRFHSPLKPFSEEYIDQIHQRGLTALSLRNKKGLTVFMLACYHQSMKCLNYLLDLKINDAHLQDNFGDTCLHYAAARRNEILIDKLLKDCHADVNGGNCMRPSVLDVFRFHCEQNQIIDQTKNEQIERLLLDCQARIRCPLRRTCLKRKASISQTLTETQIENGRNYARLAEYAENLGRIDDAEKNYQQAINCFPSDRLERANYIGDLARIRFDRGNYQSALVLVKEALIIREKLEENTDEIVKLRQSQKSIEERLSISMNQ